MASLLGQTTKLAPDYAPAWLQLADLHFKNGKLTEAEHAYRMRLELLPDDPYARLGLTRIAIQNGRNDEARKRVEELATENPGFPPGHNLYADILAAAGDDIRAARQRLLARAAGRFRQAEDPWLDELVDWCFDYETLCLRGSVDALSQHGDRGKSLFERAIQLRPDDLPAYEYLGNLYLDSGDPGMARDTYERGLSMAPGVKPSARFRASLSRSYRLLHQPSEAARIAREGLTQIGEEAELHEALAAALGELGELDAAADAMRDAVACNPGDPELHYKLAVALLADQRIDEAVEALHRSYELDPSFPSTLALLAKIEIDSGRWRKAVQYLEALYESNPDLPEARQKMAYCHLRAGVEAQDAGDLDAAEQHYRAGLAIDRDNAELPARLGALYLIQRRFADAIEPLEMFHHLQRDNPQSALFLGQAYAAVGRRDDARRILTEGVQVAEKAGNDVTARHCRDILERLP
jgi:HemY protein